MPELRPLRVTLVGLALAGFACLPAFAQEPLKPKFNIFSDLRYEALNQETGEKPFFGIGEFVLLSQVDLGQNFYALAEATIFYNTVKQAYETDLDRAYLTYTFGDTLTAGIGRRYVPLGYWNDHYHHGAMFQPTIERPKTIFFDQGMLYPLDEGLWVEGTGLGPTKVDYTVMISNGQSGSPQHDANVHKAILARAGTRLFRGARLGASLMADKLAAGKVNGRPDLTLPRDEDFKVLGADFQYKGHRTEIMAEHFRFRELDGVSTFDSQGTFLYGGVAIGDWTPYGLLERLRIAEGSPVFASFLGSQDRWTAGIRYTFQAPVTFKAEWLNIKRRGFSSTEKTIMFQVAFGF